MEKTWKVLDLLNTTTDFLKQKNIENARLNAELMLASVLNLNRVHLYVEFERPLKIDELSLYRTYVSRRIKNEPLQYILGETEFMGLPFKVNPSVLIPRPETEILCEEILKLKNRLKPPVNVLDIGTGSGCIAVSIASLWPETQVVAIDISTEAIDTARANARMNKVENITFLRKNLFSEWTENTVPKNYSVIVSNPPYIARREMDGLQNEVKDYEPHIALTDDEDGLKFYRQIFSMIKSKTFKAEFALLEMSGAIPEKIIDEAGKCNFYKMEVIKDLTGIDRVLKIKI